MRPAWIPLLALSLPPLGRAQQPITFKNTQIAVDSGIQQVVAADVNGDGNADLIFLSQGKLSILIGNGDGTFRAPNQATALGYSTMVAADLNRDGNFAAPLRSPAPSPYHAMQGVPVAADVNGDGIPDLIGPGVIAIGAGDGTFSKTLTPCSGASGLNGSTSDSAVASFKGAGNLDLALVAAQMSGAGMFQLEVATAIACFANGAAAYSAGPNIFDNSGLALSYSPVTYLASAGDFNGDGHADVLIYSSAPPPNVFAYSVIFGDGNGGFKKPVSTGPYASSAGTANLYVTKPVVIDFNGDGKSDLVQIGGKG